MMFLARLDLSKRARNRFILHLRYPIRGGITEEMQGLHDQRRPAHVARILTLAKRLATKWSLSTVDSRRLDSWKGL